MPEGEAPHPRPGNPCGVCMEVNDDDGNPLRGHDLGCGGTEQLHWFCSLCIANLWWCPLCRRRHRLCTAPLPRETQDEDLTLQTRRTLIRQKVWNDGAREDSPDVEWLDVLTDEDPATPPPPPPLARTNLGAARPGRGLHGLRPQPRRLQRRATGQSAPPLATCPTVGATSAQRTKRTTATSSSPSPPASRLPSAGWWGTRNGRWASPAAMTRGATERLMAAYLTWRGIPPPRSLESLIQRTLQPHVPPPQPGTYGNAAVARMMARGTRLDGSSYSPRRTTATITSPPPRSRATTATTTTNVRAQTSAATSSTFPNPSTTAPPTPAAEPHQQHAADATWTTGDQAPSRASTPQSPRQERASKWRNDNQHNTTRPQGAGDTEHHLPGAEPYPAPRIQGRWVTSPGSPPAPHTRTGYRPRAPQGARNP